MEKMKSFVVRVPVDLHKKIKNYCTDNEITLQTLFSNFLKNVIKTNSHPSSK
jgi:hypothetical protein